MEITPVILLLRGINVGGKNILPMAELQALLEDLGATQVTTYIQSGNVVMKHPEREPVSLAAAVASKIEQQFDFEPRVLALTRETLDQAAAANPFPDGEGDPSKLHLYFLTEEPTAEGVAAAESLCAASESFAVRGRAAYLYAPDGIARSKLAAGMERALGVAGTGRNWRTVQKLLALAATMEP
jgi:uncharacterized protein (DUF1697 family)